MGKLLLIILNYGNVYLDKLLGITAKLINYS